ncbi:hypothetical protein FHP25_26975 [Vineibacter terrae]|uniref:Uncharacterized protein n=1 Tax=Vineibacter terrae TaxID=2586908 RepID=A0A5C8PEZ3_9HYPH|nr:hypothetical protein [Vineibacter terrae]TXL72072.1 hypothetical protein FHP25_26975 [Vineibacter terrae]
MSDPTADDRATAAVAAHLLSQGATVHRLSAALTVASVLALPSLALLHPRPLPALATATLAVVIGLAELWLALRVAFDARIFEQLARGEAGGSMTTASFDGAMGALGLMPADKAGRPVAARVRGAMGLLRRQATMAVAQLVVIGVSGWILVVVRG